MKRPHTVQHARSFSFRLLFQDDTNPIHFTFHTPPPPTRKKSCWCHIIQHLDFSSAITWKQQKPKKKRVTFITSPFFFRCVGVLPLQLYLHNFPSCRKRKKEIKNNINPYCDVKLFNGYPTRMFIFLPQSKRLLIDGIEYWLACTPEQKTKMMIQTKKNKRRVAISSYNTPLSDDNNINHFIKKTMGLAEPFNTKHNRHTITGIQYVSPPPSLLWWMIGKGEIDDGQKISRHKLSIVPPTHRRTLRVCNILITSSTIFPNTFFFFPVGEDFGFFLFKPEIDWEKKPHTVKPFLFSKPKNWNARPPAMNRIIIFKKGSISLKNKETWH